MSRPASVTVVAVLSILGSLFTLLMSALMAAVAFMPLPGMAEQTPVMRYGLLMNVGLFLTLGVWGIVTAVGLFRMKPWARTSTLVFSAGLVCFAALSFLPLMLIPVATPPGVPESFMKGVMVGMGIFYTGLLAVGIWWLILLNRPVIKAQFYGGVVPVEPFSIPLSVQTIAWLLLTTCIFFPFFVFTDWPATFLAWVVMGRAAKVLYTVYGAAGVAAGYGLLKRQTWAYWLTMGYFGFVLVNLLVFYAMPNAQLRLDELNRMMVPQGMNVDVPQITPQFGILMGLIGVGLPLYFLLTRKKRYFAACEAASRASAAPPKA